MSKNTTGLLLHFEEGSRSNLIEGIIQGQNESFSDALSITDWKLGQQNIALLSFSDQTIDYIALAKKGKMVATYKNRIDFTGFVRLGQISIKEIEKKLNERIRPYFIKVSQGGGGTIPPKTWTGIISALKEERPSLVKEIDRLISLGRYSGYRLAGRNADLLLQERDALGISLQIFTGNNQLRDRVLGGWAPFDGSLVNKDESKSTAELKYLGPGQSTFLNGISTQFIQEESAIQHDLFNWPNMTPTQERGISVFTQGNRKLEVHYANRNKLENTLGVDLIYYKEEFQLFVLVQYKLMREEGDIVVYRPDSQLDVELSRMDLVYDSFHNDDKIQSHQEFRLNDDGFMLKLVPPKGLTPASGELIKGMYIPRQYMHFLLGENGPKGKNGGVKITFENTPRYLTNTQFAEGIHQGWIGTRRVQSAALASILKEFYETGRAMIFSSESKMPASSK